MGELNYIYDHPRYSPKRVMSFLYFRVDKRLNDTAVNIYAYLLRNCHELHGSLYCKFGSVEDLRDAYQVFVGKTQKMPSITEVATGVTLLRKFQYIKFIYHPDLQAKVIILPKHVGELA